MTIVSSDQLSVLITVACFSSSSIDFPGQNLHIGGSVCFAPGRGPNTVSALGNPHHDSRSAEEPEGRLILRALTRSRVAPLARLLRSPSQCRAINKIWGDYRRLECDPRFTLSVFMGWMKLAKRRAIRFLAAAALRSLVFFSPPVALFARTTFTLSRINRRSAFCVLCYLHLSCALADKFISIAADGTRFLLALACAFIIHCTLLLKEMESLRVRVTFGTRIAVCAAPFSRLSLSSAPSTIQI